MFFYIPGAVQVLFRCR